MSRALDAKKFADLAAQSSSEPRRLVEAGRALVDGALRIRRGGDGLYGDVERPVTKPAEAIGAWIDSMAEEVQSSEPFRRTAELREAVVAAAEEVDAAVAAEPRASRLAGALRTDALGAIEERARWWQWPPLPWVVAGVLGGVVVGLLVQRNNR